MDSLTQAVLGAGIQGALLGRYQGRRALLYGALLGTVPDLDVVISYVDPIDAMTRHRGFSHSLALLSGLAAVLAVGWHRWRQPPYSVWRLFLTLWLVLITHPLLDAFTSYGTQLAWPWTPIPVSWSSIFIIDPFFTLPLLLAVLIYTWRGPGTSGQVPAAGASVPRDATARWLWVALAWCVLYLGLGLVARQEAERRALAALPVAQAEGAQVFGTALPLNILGWRVVVREGDNVHEIVLSLLDGDRAPERLSYPAGNEYQAIADSHPSYRRLAWFSGGWLRLVRDGDALVAEDLRMGMAQRATFRFAIACQDGDGGWRLIQPVSLRHADDRGAAIGAGLRRSFDPDATLPLAAWAEGALARPVPDEEQVQACPGVPLGQP